jgi:hypothetical protein
MAWKIFENLKEGKFGEVEAKVGINPTTIFNIMLAVVIAAVVIIAAVKIFKR